MTREWRPLITRSCLFEHENPFSQLHITSSEFLEEIKERGACPKCNKSRMYFCYTCLTAVDSIRDRIPHVQLPVQIAIVKHAGEVDGKSTAAHLPVLAPDYVKIYTFPSIPAYDPSDVLLFFPGENAQSLEKLWESRQNGCTTGPCVVCAKEHVSIPWKMLLFIDSSRKMRSLPFRGPPLHPVVPLCQHDIMADHLHTALKREIRVWLARCGGSLPRHHIDRLYQNTWKQTKRIYLDAKIKGLPCAVLEGGYSAFWRPQRGKPSTWLATAEAVHLAVTQLLALQGCAGHVDDLLFFFKFFYTKISSRYCQGVPNTGMPALPEK